MGIERYRTIVKLEDIRMLYENGDYEEALAQAQGIRKDRLKDSADLFLLADLYRKNGDLDTAKEFLLRLYEKKITWRVLEELMEICLAQKNPEEANIYLKEYCKISGGDPRNYIFEYRIKRQMRYPDEQLLPILQTLKAEEYTEKYAYELAKVYHKLGREEECMAECSDLILWFGEGTYVERARALQAYYKGELSIEDIRSEAKRRVREAEEQRAAAEEERKAYEEERRLAQRLRDTKTAAEEAMQEAAASLEETVTSEEPEEAEEQEEAVDRSETIREPEAVEKSEAVLEEETAEEEDFYEEEPKEPDVAREAMWEPDETAAVLREEEPETPEPEEYEQISLFPSAKEEKKANADLSDLNPELSGLLAARGIVFENVLHEFARIERVRKQLNRTLELIVTVRKKCHCLIITGEKGSGKTALGTYLAKLLYELSYVKSPRVAKINARKFNNICVEEKAEKLKDCCLIVEEAGQLTKEAALSLLEFIKEQDVLGTVILEDDANGINRLLREHPEANRMFNNRIHLPKYDCGELMEFAVGYVEEQDYGIHPEARRLLEERIEYFNRVGQKEGRLIETMNIVNQAIKKADDRNQERILSVAGTGNFLDVGEIQLTAEDFEATL